MRHYVLHFYKQGFFHVERRDQVKLRIYNDWGFFLDVDVWNVAEKEETDRRYLQMITGRRNEELYHLPMEWMLPVKYLSLTTFPGVSLAVPAEPELVLQYWYGNDYMQPRKFDKGRDASSDAFEVFMWTYAVLLYEVFWSCKLFVRLILYGVSNHALSLLALFALLAGCATALARMLARFRQTRRDAD